MNENTFKNSIKTQEELDKTQRALQILYEVSNAMRTTLELDRILYIILTGVTAHSGLSFNRAVLFLVNHKERCLEPKMAIGPGSGEEAKSIWNFISGANQQMEDLIHEEKVKQLKETTSLFNAVKSLKLPLVCEDDNLLVNTYYDGTPRHITHDEIEKYKNDILFKNFKSEELIIMPLKAKDKVNGLIVADNLYTQKSISEDDLKIFTMLANQAGLAIENSQLYEMVKHKSHTDSLTSLWNHGYFQNQLDYAVKNTAKGQSLSIMMIDLDNFKALNDTYGHQTGDVVLKETANILQDSSRESDCVCRYGGEEFAVILPETSKEQAFSIAERIRQRVSQHSFPLNSSERGLQMTLSIGIATYPEDASNKDTLTAMADKAMYISKMSGKNQTSSCDH
ncbi:MAG: sensor domain-containing diguanylate cyclase [Candidatus Omnitrophica bacterium]|nr:sensor domain-containing diguanylate cyclase [Candidatus Omnitrophota bacterium]